VFAVSEKTIDALGDLQEEKCWESPA